MEMSVLPMSRMMEALMSCLEQMDFHLEADVYYSNRSMKGCDVL